MLDFDDEIINAGQDVSNFLAGYAEMLQYIGGDDMVQAMRQEVIYNMQNRAGMTIADALTEHYKFICKQYGLDDKHLI